MTPPPELAVVRLGRMRYAEAYALQRDLAERRIRGEIDRDLLLLVEHEPTVTLGRSTRPESLPLAPEELHRRGLTVVEIERGGDVTYHGPGQLVGYPILDLGGHRRDLHWYLRQIEAALIAALARLDIAAERHPGFTGVWTRGRKIASIGIHVRHWVTTHGFALNVINDLTPFDLIVPCGIAGVEMTSVLREAEQRSSGAAEPGSRGAAEPGSSGAAEPGSSGAAEQGSSGTVEPMVVWERTTRTVIEAFGATFGLRPVEAGLADLFPQGTGSAARA
jgi:lipoate-protein ligase B